MNKKIIEKKNLKYGEINLMTDEIQCRLCGCKFSLKEAKDCECHCVLGGCNGRNIRCPNCGHDMPRPHNKQNKTSIIDKLKASIKL